MVSGSAGCAGAAGCGMAAACAPADTATAEPAAAASMPARKPASQARWMGLAGPTTRLRDSISSGLKGAWVGIGQELMSDAVSFGWGGTAAFSHPYIE